MALPVAFQTTSTQPIDQEMWDEFAVTVAMLALLGHLLMHTYMHCTGSDACLQAGHLMQSSAFAHLTQPAHNAYTCKHDNVCCCELWQVFVHYSSPYFVLWDLSIVTTAITASYGPAAHCATGLRPSWCHCLATAILSRATAIHSAAGLTRRWRPCHGLCILRQKHLIHTRPDAPRQLVLQPLLKVHGIQVGCLVHIRPRVRRLMPCCRCQRPTLNQLLICLGPCGRCPDLTAVITSALCTPTSLAKTTAIC